MRPVAWWGRLLCRLGMHRWRVVEETINNRFPEWQCTRCGVLDNGVER